jgi:hypothetical protein
MQPRYFPFRALGLRANPFSALDDASWAEVAVLPENVLVVLASGTHVQVLGEQGRGKTTVLLGLAERLRRDGLRVVYEYLPEGQRTFHSRLDGLPVFVLDEAQRLNARELRRLTGAARAGTRLIAGSHVDLRRQFQAAGLRLESVTLGDGGRGHLEAVLARRLRHFALDGAEAGINFEPAAIDYLQARFGGDLRSLERFLYEVFQGRDQPGVLTAAQLRAAVGPGAAAEKK